MCVCISKETYSRVALERLVTKIDFYGRIQQRHGREKCNQAGRVGQFGRNAISISEIDTVFGPLQGMFYCVQEATDYVIFSESLNGKKEIEKGNDGVESMNSSKNEIIQNHK